MLKKRHHHERGPTNAGWLKSMHTFSFGRYLDPEHMGFGPLRVINEDRVVPSAGFSEHPHSNMEIISYVLKGQLAHKDSMGNGSTISPGDIQLMSAGTGVTHSEFNASDTEEVHFLQIWITPDTENTEPGYQQQHFDALTIKDQFHPVISPDGSNGSLRIRQDAWLYVGKFNANNTTVFNAKSTRKYWMQIVEGDVEVNGEPASVGDGIAISEEKTIYLKSISTSEVLIFDMSA